MADTLYALFVTAVCVAVLIGDAKNDFGSLIKKRPFAFVIALYAGFMCVSLSTLWVYHCKLITRNLTTNEHYKVRYQLDLAAVAKEDTTWWHNWRGFCCDRRVPPSQIVGGKDGYLQFGSQ